jgi:hypothetical protein
MALGRFHLPQERALLAQDETLRLGLAEVRDGGLVLAPWP